MLEKLSEIFPDDIPFLRSLINANERLDNLRIYADWLEQTGDPLRSQIVRLQTVMANLFRGTHQYHDLLEDRDDLVQSLLIEFDHAKQWLAAIGVGAIEGCPAAEGSQCPRRWEHLPLMEGDAATRLCHLCNKLVRYCDSIQEATKFYGVGGFVTLDPQVVRKRSDIEPFH